VLREISAFITAIASMIDGLAARAAAVSALLRDPATSFVLVSSPRREAVEEAIAFAAELERAQLRLRALVVNRVHHAAAVAGRNGDLGDIDALLGVRLATLVRDSVADLGARASADGAALDRLRAAFPALDLITVDELPVEVHDLQGLRQVAASLGYQVSSRSEASPSAAP